MSDPDRVFILSSDLEDINVLEDGRCEHALVSNSPMHNVHGEPRTTEYIRADLLAAKEVKIAELEAEIAEFIHGERVGPND